MRLRLAESDSRIDHDPMGGDSRRNRPRHPRLQRVIDVQQHVVIARIVLHGFRQPLGMHQADRNPCRGHHAGQGGIEVKAGHVVDDNRPGLQRRLRHAGLASVDRDRDPVRKGADRGQDAGGFVGRGNRGRAGARRFTADIEDRGPLRRQGPRLYDRIIGATIRETVGRRVHDPHEMRPIHGQANQRRARARQRLEHIIGDGIADPGRLPAAQDLDFGKTDPAPGQPVPAMRAGQGSMIAAVVPHQRSARPVAALRPAGATGSGVS